MDTIMMPVRLETILLIVIQKLLQKKMLKNLCYKLKNSLVKWKLYYDFSIFLFVFMIISEILNIELMYLPDTRLI